MLQPTNPAKFLQESPRLGNQFEEDTALQAVLKRVLPPTVYSSVEPDLKKWGNRVLGDVLKYGRESEENPPKLVQYDAFARRIDDIRVAGGWDKLKDISAEEGLVAAGYERKYAEFSRLYQYVKVYLFAASSCVFDCPLSMTDGAARLMELYADDKLKQEVLPHLMSRDPQTFWTSGQWMTEKTGGSDVGNTETIAVKNKDGSYNITGYKFFTSAITSDATVMLARVTDENGNNKKGSRGLSAFYVRIRDAENNLNGITVHKLKHKLGTKAVPTAELELNNTKGQMVGQEGSGVRIIASILNITRIHNAVNAVAFMRRAIAVARDYTHRRSVFGRTLAKVPLHLAVLADMEVEFRGSLQFLVDVIVKMGVQETKKDNKDNKLNELLLRVLTPLLKLYTAKQAIAVVSEGVESLGGTGYMEDSDMPRLLRDAQVLSIWEGTTNVLSMDVWRPLAAPNAFSALGIKQGFASLKKFTEDAAGDMPTLESNARRFAYSLSRLYAGALLVEQAKWSKSRVDAEIAARWCARCSSVSLGNFSVSLEAGVGNQNWREFDREIALDLDENGNARGMGNTTPLGVPRARY